MTRQSARCSVVLALAAVATGPFLLAQGFNARTGAWTFTITMKGAMPMEGLPPAARAALEAELSKPQTMNSCVTAEDIKELKLGNAKDDNDDEHCKIVSSKFTATTADITRECKGDNPHTETLHYEAPTPQTLTGNVTRKSKDGVMTINMAGKWVAAQCKD